MKKIIFLLVLVLVTNYSFSQEQLDKSGYYDELIWGGISKYHLENMKVLIDISKIDTCDYKLSQFMGNSDIKNYYIKNKIRRKYVEMSVDENKVKTIKITEHDTNNPSPVKEYMLFYMQSKDLLRTTYYIYRYG